jgi:hypothetical protein
MGARDWKDHSLKPAQARSWRDHILTNARAGGACICHLSYAIKQDCGSGQALAKSKTISQNNQYKMGCWSASRGRTPAQQAQGPLFNLQHFKKEKKNSKNKKKKAVREGSDIS